jgi:hypothetical protein
VAPQGFVQSGFRPLRVSSTPGFVHSGFRPLRVSSTQGFVHILFGDRLAFRQREERELRGASLLILDGVEARHGAPKGEDLQRFRIGSGLGCLARGRLDVVLLRPGRTQLVDSFFEGGRFGDGCASLLRLCRTQPVGGD